MIQLACYQTSWAMSFSQKEAMLSKSQFTSALKALAGTEKTFETIEEVKTLVENFNHNALQTIVEKELAHIPKDTKLDVKVKWRAGGVEVEDFFINLKEMTISFKGKALPIDLNEVSAESLIQQLKAVSLQDEVQANSFLKTVVDIFIPQASADQIDIVKEGATVLGTGLGTTIASAAASGAAAATLVAPVLIVGGLVVALAGMGWMIYGFVADPEERCVEVFGEFMKKLDETKATCQKDSQLIINTNQPIQSFDTYHLIDTLMKPKSSLLSQAYAKESGGPNCQDVLDEHFSYLRLRGKKSCLGDVKKREGCKKIALVNNCLNQFMTLKPKTIDDSSRSQVKKTSPEMNHKISEDAKAIDR